MGCRSVTAMLPPQRAAAPSVASSRPAPRIPRRATAENALYCERVNLRYTTRNRFAHIQTATRDQLTAKARQFVDIVENICLELRRIHVLHTENVSRGPGHLGRSH